MSQNLIQRNSIDSEAALNIFLSAPTPYLVLSPDFTIVEANEARLFVTNTTRENILGRYLFEAYPDNPEDLKATGVSNLRFSLETVLKTKASHRMNIQKYDIPIKTSEGVKFEERYWSPMNFPILDSQGAVKYIIHQVADVTEEVKSKKQIADIKEIAKAITAERLRLLALFDQAPIGICLLKGPDLFIEFANKAYRKISGEKRKLDGLRFADAFSDIDPETLSHSLNAFKSGKTHMMEDLKVTADWDQTGRAYEKIFFIIWEPLTDLDGKTEGLITLVYDDTEKIRARLESKNNLIDLHRERDLRERFVATLTHDLRTPLTAAKMSAQMITRNAGDIDSVRRYSEKIIHSLERCDNMISNLLDANRIKAGEKLSLELSHCSLRQIAEHTIDELTTVHGDRFVLIAPPGPIEGVYNSHGLERILENLCNNAIKYGSKKDKVTITIGPTIEAVSIHVHNWGNLISPEDQKHLFDQYSRAGSGEVGDEKGWGLGLTLVKGIAEAHFGSVTVESTTSKGTIFTVTLPNNISQIL